MGLSSQQVTAFETDGILSGIRAVSAAVADTEFRTRFNELETREGRDTCQIGLVDRHFHEEFIWTLATHPEILDCVEGLMGPDILLLATHFFCKYGPQEKFVSWHQDVTYWGLEPPDAITVWFAIDDSDCDNGCMRVIPGTHSGIRDHGESSQEGNLLSINQEISVSDEEDARAADIILKAGEISIHHGKLIHGSLPNRSTRRRCGLTLRYVSPRVRAATRNSMKDQWRPILVRGQDRFNNFKETPAPFA